jgi:hypothetical protein
MRSSDCGQCHPRGKEHMLTRSVTSTASAEGLSDMLQNSLGKQEQKYGVGRTGE